MKIEYRQGDLFQTDVRHIVHGCNAQGVMGKGVAKLVKELYPKAYNEYLSLWMRNKALVPGTAQFVDCGDKVIINDFTFIFYLSLNIFRARFFMNSLIGKIHFFIKRISF